VTTSRQKDPKKKNWIDILFVVVRMDDYKTHAAWFNYVVCMINMIWVQNYVWIFELQKVGMLNFPLFTIAYVLSWGVNVCMICPLGVISLA